MRPRDAATGGRTGLAAIDVALTPDALEREFRAWEWPTAQRRARGAIIAATAIFLLFVYPDVLFFGPRWPLPGVIALRVSVGAFGLVCLKLLAGPPRPARFDRLLFAWTLWAVVLTGVILPATRPAAWLMHGFVVCTAIPALYLLVPLRFVHGLVVGVTMAVGYLTFVVATNAELTYMQGVVTTFALLAANVLGAVASRGLHHAQRAAFLQQRSLRHAEESLNQLVDAVPFPLVLVARDDRRVRRMNDAARALFAGPAAIDPEGAVAALVAAIPGGDAVGAIAPGTRELAARDGRGEERWLLVSTRPVVHDGEPSTLLAFADITARKATEEALARAKRDADDASRAKSMFLATMSHEMRTPLHGVLGAVQLLERAGIDGEVRDHVAIIRASARGMLQLVDGILDLTRPDAAAAAVAAGDARVTFDPRALAREVAAVVATRTHAGGLVAALDPALPERLRGDEARLRRVLLNLVDNALKYGDASPIHLVMGVLGAAEDGGVRVRFAVDNGGPAIPPEARRAIFEPFVQLERQDGLRRGFGLGLAIARQDVAAMGGELALDELAPRTTFTFTLSLATAPPDTRPAARARPVTRPLALLVAEDDPVSARLAARLLGDTGHRVTLVATGPEAVAAASAQPFDAVLMDMRLPGCDGVEATRRIRALADAARARVPIVATSANALAEDRAAYQAAGVTAIVPKPIDFAALEAVLAELAPAPPCVDAALLARHAQAIGPAEARALQALCLSTGAPLVAAIDDAAARADGPALARAAHRLASAAHSAAFAQLADAAARLESAALAGDDARRAAHHALTAAWEATRAAFDQSAASGSTPSR